MLPVNNVQIQALMRLQQMQQILQMQQMMQINQTLQGTSQNYQQQNQLERDEDDDNEDDKVMKTLFCANLDERVDEEILYELFLQAGPLERVNIPDKRTFAFIEYIHSCSAAYAMNLFQGVQLFGKPLVIKYHGQTAPPRLPQVLLPPDWGVIDKSAPQIPKHSFDNSSLRSYFNPFSTDISMNNNQGSSRYSRDQSPNRRRNDSRDNNRRERMGRERSHNSSGSYDRRRDTSRERERDRHYDDRRNNSHRNSEKRNNHYL